MVNFSGIFIRFALSIYMSLSTFFSLNTTYNIPNTILKFVPGDNTNPNDVLFAGDDETAKLGII